MDPFGLRHAPDAPTYREHELFARGPAMAGVWELDGDSEVHGHDFVELAVIGGGRGRHVSVHGSTALRAGDLIVLRPGAWHGFVGCRQLEVANCCLSARSLETELSFLYDDPALRELLWLGPIAYGRQGVSSSHISPERARLIVDEIAALQAESPVNRTLHLGRLLTILGHVLVSTGSVPAEAVSAGSIHPAVASTVAAIRAGPEQPWRLTDLASRAALDPAYLNRLFQRHLGLSPMAYLARIRAERAAGLLARTTSSIASIGAQVGWPDPTYFARRFRTLVGLTPTEYRRRAARARHPRC